LAAGQSFPGAPRLRDRRYRFPGTSPRTSPGPIGPIRLDLAPADYARWLSDEPDPHDVMRPFPAEPMRMTVQSTGSNWRARFAPRPIALADPTHSGPHWLAP
jgi:hypothetical protein